MESFLRFPRWLCLGLLVLSAGCRTPAPLPGVDLSTAGWKLQRGQALWTRSAGQPEIAGELLLASNPRGDCVVQFSKIPFPIVAAQTAGDHWQIEFGARPYRVAGIGRPPARWLWFQLPAAVAGGDAPQPWRFESLGDGRWRLANPRSGELLEGAFFP